MPDLALLADLSVRTVSAVLLGALIGFERQWRLRTAGIRTNALVAGGAALFVIVGAVDWNTTGTVDSTRVAAQVVSGIGFLGAGVILRDGANIRGLTTAATLWCAAAVGSLAGAGMVWFAAVGSLAILATNTLLRPISRFINRRLQDDVVDAMDETDYVLEVITSEKSEQRVRALVVQTVDLHEYTLRALDSRQLKHDRTRLVASVGSHTGDPNGLQYAVQRLMLDPKVTSARWWESEPED